MICSLSSPTPKDKPLATLLVSSNKHLIASALLPLVGTFFPSQELHTATLGSLCNSKAIIGVGMILGHC